MRNINYKRMYEVITIYSTFYLPQSYESPLKRAFLKTSRELLWIRWVIKFCTKFGHMINVSRVGNDLNCFLASPAHRPTSYGSKLQIEIQTKRCEETLFVMTIMSARKIVLLIEYPISMSFLLPHVPKFECTQIIFMQKFHIRCKITENRRLNEFVLA